MTYPTANANYGVANGSNSTNVFITQLQTRDPTTNDVNYPVTKRWVNVTTGKEFILANFTSNNGSTLANWINLTNGTAGNIDSLSAEAGTNPVYGDSSSNINVYGDSTTISISGDSATHTLTASVLLPAQYNVLASNVNSIQGIAPSTAGFVLTSNGSAMPSFQAPSGSSLVMNPFGSTPNANAATITTGTLTLQPADGTHPGAISLSAQTLGSGTKTFTSAPIMPLTGMVLGNGANALSAIPLTDGQLVIGSSSGPPIAASLTAGAGISITPGANSITIASSVASFAYTDKSATFTADSNNGYFISATCTATLPASPVQGDAIAFAVDAATTVLTITANTGQVIRSGSAVTASGGTCVSTAEGDSIYLVYRSTGSSWVVVGAPQGVWILT